VRRLLVLWCPDWPVRARAAAERLPEDAPIALLHRGEVLACSASARAAGVRRGLRRREAQARCPELVVLDHDPSLDARAFEPVLEALEAALPGVHPLRPGLAAVRVRGAARYYGGERAAALHARGVIARAGSPGARAGIADGLFAAERAAAATTESAPVAIVPGGGSAAFLAPLPVASLGDPELADLLPRLGIRTLGAFAALPATDVADRFGPEGARLHALAAGRDERAATPRLPPREHDREVAFEPPLDRADQVAFGVRIAADELVEALLGERLVCTALRVAIEGEEGETVERVWLHPRSFSAAEVVDRVRWTLDGTLVRRDASRNASGDASGLRSPVARVVLSPESVDPAGAHERGLWGAGPDEAVHSGFSRVQGMLGHDGVLSAVPSGGRTPRERAELVPWGDRPVRRRDPREPWPGALPPPQPATVYELRRPVRVLDPRGRPVAVDERGRLSGPPAALLEAPGGAGPRELTSWAGPWPLDERWWDAAEARRAHRFQVVDRAGEAWLLSLDDRGWWAEGMYD